MPQKLSIGLHSMPSFSKSVKKTALSSVFVPNEAYWANVEKRRQKMIHAMQNNPNLQSKKPKKTKRTYAVANRIGDEDFVSKLQSLIKEEKRKKHYLKDKNNSASECSCASSKKSSASSKKSSASSKRSSASSKRSSASSKKSSAGSFLDNLSKLFA